jgi:hypothetical protein
MPHFDGEVIGCEVIRDVYKVTDETNANRFSGRRM